MDFGHLYYIGCGFTYSLTSGIKFSLFDITTFCRSFDIYIECCDSQSCFNVSTVPIISLKVFLNYN